jgi:hypothetical protein
MIKKIKGDNMKAKIIYNGKEAEIEITDEIKKLFGCGKSTEFKEGDRYYCVDTQGNVGGYFYNRDKTDEKMKLRRNMFRTTEEAEFKSQKDLLRAEMETFAEENNNEIDWNEDYRKYYIYYNYIDEKLDISNISINRDTFQIYFSSEAIAQEAISKFGDRIKKYLFNIEA